ncbi:hypothetical protein ID866_5397 [Astraeus odoratus]|nr:hypothetical protein ID866_5397 [Astraeus odoratus]
MFFRSALLLAGAGFAVAQSLSSQCSSALISVAGSPDSACLNPNGIVSLALTNSTSSVIPGVDSWLSGLCALGPCSNSSLQAIFTNITNGCSTELGELGFSTSDTANLTTYLEDAYPTIRQIWCLKDTSVNQLCVTEDLYAIQNATTTLTLSNLVGVVGQLTSGSTSVPQNVTCGDCSKAAYTIASQDYPALLANSTSSVSAYCGSSFVDGQMPSDIEETASSSNSTSSGGSTGGAAALSMGGLHIGAVMLVAVSSTFVIFA